MTNRDALTLLDNATGMLQLNRADHQRVADALRVLSVLVDEKEAHEAIAADKAKKTE